MSDVWPAFAFTLAVGLLCAAYLLRAVRRFERRADRLLKKYDARDEESEMKHRAAIEESRAEMREVIDKAIEQSRPSGESRDNPAKGGA